MGKTVDCVSSSIVGRGWSIVNSNDNLVQQN